MKTKPSIDQAFESQIAKFIRDARTAQYLLTSSLDYVNENTARFRAKSAATFMVMARALDSLLVWDARRFVVMAVLHAEYGLTMLGLEQRLFGIFKADARKQLRSFVKAGYVESVKERSGPNTYRLTERGERSYRHWLSIAEGAAEAGRSRGHFDAYLMDEAHDEALSVSEAIASDLPEYTGPVTVID